MCIFSGWSASPAGSVARSSVNIIPLNMQSVCALVRSGVLWCVFGTTHIYWVQHWYCCNAAPSFSEHTYDVLLCDALWVIFWVRGTLCCTLKRLYELNMAFTALLGYHQNWDITKSPIGLSTALTPVGRSFEIGRSKSRWTIPPYIAPPLTVATRQMKPSSHRRGQQPCWVLNEPTAVGVGALPRGLITCALFLATVCHRPCARSKNEAKK